MRLLLCAVAVAVAFALVGCGSDSGSTSARAGSTTGTSKPREILHYVNHQPRPRSPGPHPGARVDHLIVRDVRKGIGPAIQSGDRGIFDFISTDWVTGKPIDASWHRRRPFETEIEHGVVIDGWWQGIPGMRVGGRRQIIVPPSLGFTQTPELVNTTAYFDVVLVQINPQQPPGLGGRRPAPASGSTGGGRVIPK